MQSDCWRLLKELDLSQQFVELPKVDPISSAASFDDDCHELFIREWWKQLFLDVWSVREQGITPIVCGNPGVGKSRFFLYFLARTIQEERARKIVLDIPFKFGNNVMYVLEDGYVSKSPREDVEGCDLYLFDAGGNKAGNMLNLRRTIVCSSPDRQSHLLATKNTHAYVFMPPYTLPELQTLASLPYFQHVAHFVEPLYNILGGIARTVVNKTNKAVSVEENRQKIRSYIQEHLTLRLLASLQGDIIFSAPQVSHTLIQLFPPAAGQSLPVIKLASPYVTDCLKEKLLAADKAEREKFLSVTSGVPSMSSVRGVVFELFLRSKLAEGGNYLARRLGADHSEQEVILPALECRIFGKTAEELETAVAAASCNTCHWPSISNFESVDGVWQYWDRDGGGRWSIAAFQSTVGKDHTVKANMLHKIITALRPHNVFRLYFVVPRDAFRSFRAQSYLSMEGKVMEEARLPWRAQNVTVEQWALLVDVEQAVPNL
jgi:hypothetical protein